MLNWSVIEHVFLDMDGTLLDLHYDNHFWLEYVPQCYARKHGMEIENARDQLYARYRAAEGTLDWYCVDYWTRQLDMDIARLKAEVDHLIAVHPHVVDFLDAVRVSGRRIVLVTNAHGKALALKMDRTRLGGHFDRMICAHDLRLPKEAPGFWERFQETEPFVREAALLVDDSLNVLRAARDYGIGQLLAIRQPDSRAGRRDTADFAAIDHFSQLLPVPELK